MLEFEDDDETEVDLYKAFPDNTFRPCKVWGTLEEIERKKRMYAAVAAYVYENENWEFMTDFQFDTLCRSIDPSINTGHKVLDEFFRTTFNPDTGQWIHDHPDLDGVKRLAHKIRTIRESTED